MSAESKKSLIWTLVLIVFGVLALYCSTRWLAILVPAAVLVYFGSSRLLLRGDAGR